MANLTLRRGDDLALVVTFKENNVAHDMTDWTMAASLRLSGCTDLETTIDLEMTSEWVDITLGQARTVLPRAETEGLSPDDYEFLLRMTSPLGVVVSASRIVQVT